MTGSATLVLVSMASYLLGAIPFGLLFSKLWGVDPRLSGSKNIGATNVLRTAGVLPAILTLIFDISKGGIAVLIAKNLNADPAWVAGLAAIVGHNFPLYLKFRGGKGVATSMGTLFALSPEAGLVVTGIWLIVAVITRFSSLAAIVSLGVSPIIFTLLKKSDMIGFTMTVAVLALIRHKDNIKRLLKGTEKRIGERVLFLIFCITFLLNPLKGAQANESPLQKSPSEERFSSLKEESFDKGLRLSESAILFFILKEQNPELILSQSEDTDSPLIPLKKAERAFNGGIKEALFTGIPYLIETFRLAAGDLFWLINLGMLFLFTLTASIIFAFFVTSIARLPVELPLLIHESTEKKITILYLLILITGALAGIPYFAGAVLLLGAIHNPSRTQRLSAILCFIFLLLLPFILRLEMGLLKILSDREIRAVTLVNEKKDNGLILTLNDKDSTVYLFSKALALKRVGRIDEAAEILESLSTSPDYRIFNNLGNCLFLKGDLSSAEKHYQKALELKKNPQSLYNLSQLFKERLDFEKGKYYYEEAMKLDAELISSFTKISSESPNRFLMDIGLGTEELLKFSLKSIASNRADIKIQEIFLPLIFFGLLFIRPPVLAYRCSRCGKIICNICQRRELWGRMCPDCYEVLVTPDRTDSKTRVQRLLLIQKKKSQKKKSFWLLSIFPGISQVSAGAMLQGILILSLTGFSIMSFIAYKHFLILNMKQFYLIWIALFSAVIAIMAHLISLRRLFRTWP